MLICDNLTCLREDRLIFKGVGLCLAPGALLLLRGPNGSGKTSLLKTIAGLIPPAEGGVSWRGEAAHGSETFLNHLTYIGHRNGIKTECTVEENIRFWAEAAGTETLIEAALRYFSLSPMRDVPCWRLSAGWQRKVALSRLLVSPTPLWLLDEPTNFLDDASIRLVSELIEARVAQDGIVIVATHAMRSALPGHTLRMEDFR